MGVGEIIRVSLQMSRFMHVCALREGGWAARGSNERKSLDSELHPEVARHYPSFLLALAIHSCGPCSRCGCPAGASASPPCWGMLVPDPDPHLHTIQQ